MDSSTTMTTKKTREETAGEKEMFVEHSWAHTVSQSSEEQVVKEQFCPF